MSNKCRQFEKWKKFSLKYLEKHTKMLNTLKICISRNYHIGIEKKKFKEISKTDKKTSTNEKIVDQILRRSTDINC